ncbi:MAG: extracellular solute-binding protein [Spirochaetaceae bacterium]
MKKTLLLLIFSLTTIFVFAGNNAEKEAIEKTTELSMYLLGDTVADYPMMLEELNVLMENDINATLDVKFTTWVDWQTKLRLILASGEKVDLMHMAPWGIYSEQAQSGNLLDLSELGPIHAPETWASYSEEVLKQAEVNGGIYMMPFNYVEPTGQGIVYRKDLAKKYGMDEINSADSLYNFLKSVKENEDMIPYNAGEFDLAIWSTFTAMFPTDTPYASKGILYESDGGVGAYIDYGNPEEILYDFEEKPFRSTMEFFNKLYTEELITRNVLSNTVGSRDAFIAGKSAITCLNPLNANEQYQKLSESHPDWELGLWMPQTLMNALEKPPAINNGLSIPVSSENPIKALKLIEKLHQDQKYHDLTTYGIRGVHWDLDENDQLVMPEGLSLDDSGFPWDQPCPWGWREAKFYRLNPLTSAAMWDEVRDTQTDLQKKLVDAKWTTFIFDRSSVSTEISALNTVRSGTFRGLAWGILDTEDEYAELVQDYKDAGIDTVKAELQKQWSAYLKENK